MSRTDWRSPGAYEELRPLDVPGFAWEFLRRNSDFQQDRGKLERAARRGALNQAEADAFARRWGAISPAPPTQAAPTRCYGRRTPCRA
jgi:hypothetical protein